MSNPSPVSGEKPLSLAMIVAGTAGLALLAVFAVFTWTNAASIPDQELARRCAVSTPQWDSYQEDVKGQVGARPVAEWNGKPIAAELTDGFIRVSFLVTGSWAARECAIPILIKDPGGEIRIGHGRGDREGNVVYSLPLPPSHATTLPWLEIQYPHHRDRLAFDADGRWSIE